MTFTTTDLIVVIIVSLPNASESLSVPSPGFGCLAPFLCRSACLRGVWRGVWLIWTPTLPPALPTPPKEKDGAGDGLRRSDSRSSGPGC